MHFLAVLWENNDVKTKKKLSSENGICNGILIKSISSSALSSWQLKIFDMIIPTDLLRFGWHWRYLCWLQYLQRKGNFWLNSCIVHITASSVTRPRYELQKFIWKRRCHDGAVTVSQHPKHECVQLLWSILERAISQQFQVNFFACKQFSRSPWDTHGMRIFAIVGISCLRKWPKPCTCQWV